MTETKVGYQAVFYSGDKRIEVSEIRETHEQAEKDIEKKNEEYEVFKYTPWTHTSVEVVRYRVRKEDAPRIPTRPGVNGNELTK